MRVSKEDVDKLLNKARNFRSRMAEIKAEGEGLVKEVVTTVEIGTTSFLLGMARGRWGEIDVMGVPGDLLGAILLKVGAFGAQVTGWDHSYHLHNFGNAFLASYLTVLGVGVGAKGGSGGTTAAAGAAALGSGTSNGRALPDGKGRVAGVTEDEAELIRLANRAGSEQG